MSFVNYWVMLISSALFTMILQWINPKFLYMTSSSKNLAFTSQPLLSQIMLFNGSYFDWLKVLKISFDELR